MNLTSTDQAHTTLRKKATNTTTQHTLKYSHSWNLNLDGLLVQFEPTRDKNTFLFVRTLNGDSFPFSPEADTLKAFSLFGVDNMSSDLFSRDALIKKAWDYVHACLFSDTEDQEAAEKDLNGVINDVLSHDIEWEENVLHLNWDDEHGGTNPVLVEYSRVSAE